jgi:hypothetical protein
LAVVAAVVPCAPAVGQPAGAKLVEQGFGDVGPSRTSLRVEPLDLRQPLDFEQVYSLGRVRAFRSDEVFLRVSGGITAVFPRSVYVKNKDGTGPAIPPGTTFYIGKLPEEFGAEPAPRAPSPLALDFSAPRIAPGRKGQPKDIRPPNSAEAPSMWENEEYRGARIGQILRKAMAAGGK